MYVRLFHLSIDGLVGLLAPRSMLMLAPPFLERKLRTCSFVSSFLSLIFDVWGSIVGWLGLATLFVRLSVCPSVGPFVRPIDRFLRPNHIKVVNRSFRIKASLSLEEITQSLWNVPKNIEQWGGGRVVFFLSGRRWWLPYQSRNE